MSEFTVVGSENTTFCTSCHQTKCKFPPKTFVGFKLLNGQRLGSNPFFAAGNAQVDYSDGKAEQNIEPWSTAEPGHASPY